MKIRKYIPVLSLLAAAISGQTFAAASDEAKVASASFSRFGEADKQFQFLADNCMQCHNVEDWAGSLAMDLIEPNEIPDHPEIWEKVISKLQGRMMPPAGQPRADIKDTDAFIAWTEQFLDHSAEDEIRAGRVGLHRLNRKEYGNAVRDMFGIEVDTAALLPADSSVDGFDNVAEALRASPTFLDQSLSAARVVVSQAVGNPAPRPGGSTYFASGNQRDHIAGLPLGTRGGVQVEHYFPADGEYVLNIGNLASALWVFNQEFTHTLVATLDGVKFFEMDIGGGDDLKAIDQIGDPAVDEINSRLKDIRFSATSGPHRIGVAFVHRSFAESEGTLHSMTPGSGANVIALNSIEVQGPFNPAGLSETPAREKIFSCYPQSAAEETSCAQHIIGKIARQAYRGPVSESDMDKLMGLYDQTRATQGFEMGVRYALTAIIASPKFFYRVETTPEGAKPGSVHALSDLELASRLSFFIWSSIPDEPLLDLAEAGQLSNPETLKEQVWRMLEDPRSETLASSFAYQWLNLAAIDEVDPDPAIFRDVDRGIRPLLKQEVALFTREVFMNNRPITELLTADYTFLNERLALHYNMDGIKGDDFRKVKLDNSMRYGLLGKGGVLMASAYPDRTSPVLRGAYILEYIMGTPPPLPPPNVEALSDNKDGARKLTIRERLAEHRSNPSCGGCHGFMDPLGFALENFDSVGRFRTVDRTVMIPVDTDGVLPDGKKIKGVDDLRAAIMERPQLFAENLSEHLLMYALGRPVEAEDMPSVRKIVTGVEKGGFHFFDIVLGVVQSDQFRYVEAEAAKTETSRVASND